MKKKFLSKNKSNSALYKSCKNLSIVKEARDIFDLLKKAESDRYFSTESNLVHLVSVKWFDKWAQYTGYDIL